MKRRTKTGAENDVVHARHMYVYLGKAGVTAGIKRQMRRRERRDAKRELLDDDDRDTLMQAAIMMADSECRRQGL